MDEALQSCPVPCDVACAHVQVALEVDLTLEIGPVTEPPAR
jgi:hypothetical protein